jgi:hypothetical protein
MPTRPLVLHPDRLFPADPATRAVARRLFEAVRETIDPGKGAVAVPPLLQSIEPIRPTTLQER